MKKIKQFILVLVSLVALLSIFSAVAVAQSTPCGDNCSNNGGPSGNTTPVNECDKVESSSQLNKCVQSNKIVSDLQLIVNFLSAGVGIVVIGMIILGGIQYSMAGDNPQATTAAKQRITNSLLALVAFIFLFAFLQWLIPGGIFG